MPVVVVGNITVGGSGKTPLVAALALALAQRGFHPGIVSRGYGRDGDDGDPLPVGPDDDPRRVGDEPLLLARAGYPVVVARDRVAAGRALLARHPRCDVILSDDGLQHYRLARERRNRRRRRARAASATAGCCRPARCASPPRGSTTSMRSWCWSTTGDAAPPELPGAFTMTLVGDRFVRVDDPLTTAPASAFARERRARAGRHRPSGAVFRAARGDGHRGRRRTRFPIITASSPAISHIADAQAILMTEKDALKCEAFADERCWYLPVRARIDERSITLVEGKLRGSQAA